jgi:histidine ammonia-lyase
VQAFAWAAGEQLRTAADHLFAITACEFIAGSQARHLAPGDGSYGLRATYAWIAETVPPVLVDRPLGPEVTALTLRLRTLLLDDFLTLE